MGGCLLLVARTPSVLIVDAWRISGFLEEKGFSTAPVLMPLEYPADAYDWGRHLYVSDRVLSWFRSSVGFSGVWLLVLTGGDDALENSFYCSEESRACLVKSGFDLDSLINMLKSKCLV